MTQVVFLKLISGEEIISLSYIFEDDALNKAVNLVNPVQIKHINGFPSLSHYCPYTPFEAISIPPSSILFLNDVNEEWGNKYSKFLADIGLNNDSMRTKIKLLLGDKELSAPSGATIH